MKGKPTVVFCASVHHAEEIAERFRASGVDAACVSGSTKSSERKRILAEYEAGTIPVLCACDLLNEGWDSPHTQVLFMARPTMSKTIYMQQLGRGMRKSPGKEFLMVFDFVDNANLFNMPYSLHRMLGISEYTAGGLVLGTMNWALTVVFIMVWGIRRKHYSRNGTIGRRKRDSYQFVIIFNQKNAVEFDTFVSIRYIWIKIKHRHERCLDQNNSKPVLLIGQLKQ